ncbi:MAG TPA: hypothetical protein VG164_07120 [Trebonia sp.]|nr:hypothetical protein [Trebonia sp.]
MVNDRNKPPAAATVLPLLRYAAVAVAAGRIGLGVAALARPSAPARPWVGPAADELGAQVFGRAMGGRDLALGLGALAATLEAPAGRAAGAWFAAGALSDTLDVAITVAAWRRLPRITRWLIAASAGGAAIAGAAGTVATLLELSDPGDAETPLRRRARIRAGHDSAPGSDCSRGRAWPVRRSPHGERRIMAPAGRYSMKAVI